MVLPPGSGDLARVGSALPDLWPMVSPRPLPALILRELRGGDRRSVELAYGIAHHMHADAVFHSLEAFNRRVDWLSAELRSRWPALRRASFYAHVLVEMLLDRWLMERDPRPLDEYYQAFQPEILAFAAEHGVSQPDARVTLRALLERFATLQFLRTYTTADDLAKRFLGLVRTLPWPSEWHDLPRAPLVDGIAAWHVHLGPGSGELVESVRAGVVASGKLAGRT